jgi:hypothetical protein
VWLALTGILGLNRFFQNFADMPPRIPLFIFLFVLILGFFAYRLMADQALSRVQQVHLVFFQCFRIVVEILLLMLARISMLPKEMSFEGRNFDIVIGLTAIPLAWLISKKGETASRGLLLGWNILGLLLLTNVVMHGILSAPYPFQVLELQPANFIIGYFPMTWLPLFLVPTAYFFHIVSLLKIRSDGSVPQGMSKH